MYTGAGTILQRQFLAWKPYIPNFIFLFVLDPFIYLYAIAFGLGAYLADNPAEYSFFAASGLVAGTLIWVVTTDATYLTLTRLNTGLWQSQLSASIKLPAILMGESLFGAIKGTLAALIVLGISLLLGALNLHIHLWLLVPILFIGALTLYTTGQFFTAHIGSEQGFDFLWPLLYNPMFLFCGVFIPIDIFPSWLQIISWILPLSHIVELTRAVCAQQLSSHLFVHIYALAGYIILFHFCSCHLYKKRILA